MGTLKHISGEYLRNDYFVETRVMGNISKDKGKTHIDKVHFTVSCANGLDVEIHGEDVMQIAFTRGSADHTLWVYVSDGKYDSDVTALVQHFTRKTTEQWLSEAAELATEWLNGESYDSAEVDSYRGLLVHGEDMLEIDE